MCKGLRKKRSAKRKAWLNWWDMYQWALSDFWVSYTKNNEKLDLDKRIIKIRKSYSKHGKIISTPKTDNSIRDVIIPEMCFKALLQHHEAHKKIIGYCDSRYVFDFDKPLDDNSIRYVKNRACQKAGIKQIRIHDFRHSHVSLLINQGFSPFDIAKRLGHTVEMVNNVYGHWFTDAQQSMVNCLDEIYKNLV